MPAQINREVDLRGLKEPPPILRTHHALHGLREGDAQMVTTTDNGTPDDFRSYCELSGNAMLLRMEEDDM